jgi:preprotein translocase subunit SecB
MNVITIKLEEDYVRSLAPYAKKFISDHIYDFYIQAAKEVDERYARPEFSIMYMSEYTHNGEIGFNIEININRIYQNYYTISLSTLLKTKRDTQIGFILQN